MALKHPYRSGSPLILCLIFVFSIAFLAPLYHSHDHAGDYHQEHGHDHTLLLHEASALEDLSTDHTHTGSHLHIKKDIGRTETPLRFNGKSLNPDQCTIASIPVSVEQHTGRRSKHNQLPMPIFRSTSYDCLSGLSPPPA